MSRPIKVEFVNRQAPAALLSVEQTRRILGIARSTLYEIIGSGELEVVKIRGRTMFEPATVSAFIEQRRGRR